MATLNYSFCAYTTKNVQRYNFFVYYATYPTVFATDCGSIFHEYIEKIWSIKKKVVPLPPFLRVVRAYHVKLKGY